MHLIHQTHFSGWRGRPRRRSTVCCQTTTTLWRWRRWRATRTTRCTKLAASAGQRCWFRLFNADSWLQGHWHRRNTPTSSLYPPEHHGNCSSNTHSIMGATKSISFNFITSQFPELCSQVVTDQTIDLLIDLIGVICVSVQMSPVGVVCSVFASWLIGQVVWLLQAWMSADIDYGSEGENWPMTAGGSINGPNSYWR